VSNHMANIISLGGEARDFKQAEYISTGQSTQRTPGSNASLLRYHILTTYPASTYIGFYQNNAIKVLDFILPKTTSAILTLSAKTLFRRKPNRKYYGFVIVNDTVMFAKGMFILDNVLISTHF
jgi:hypothetical protein